MSENFDFLRNFNNDLHYLACIIEDEIYDSPSAVLSDATTFLEIIIYEIFKKYELTMESVPHFQEKVDILFESNLISYELKKNLKKAYSIRNKMHSYNGDAKNHIQLNKNRAIHIHKFLFNAAWLYYEEYSDNHFKMMKVSYTHPSKLKSKVFSENKINEETCIVCGRPTKEGETFCSECKYKIEKCDNLKTIRKHFGYKDGFKRNDLINMGFEKGYVGSFILELKQDELIYSINKLHFIDKERSVNYIREVDEMIAVEKMLSDFKLRNIDLNEMISHEFYSLGKEGQYPFVGLYNLISEIYYADFLNRLNSDMTIEELLSNSNLDINEWYFGENTQKSLEFIIFNEKVIDEIFHYKNKGLNTSEIQDKLKISNEIIEHIRNDEAEIGQLYQQKADEYRFSRFMRIVSQEKVKKSDALKKVGITQNDLDELLIRYPAFQDKFTKSYTLKKMSRFLKHFEYYNYDYSLKKCGLIEEEIDDWIKKGHKMKEYEDNIFYTFCKDFNDVCAKKYVEYRKKGKTRYNSSKKIHRDMESVEKLINNNKQYRHELDIILVDFTINAFENGLSKEEVFEKYDITFEWLEEALLKGQNGDEDFIGLYETYSKNLIPNQMNEFMKTIKQESLKNTLNKLKLSENEVECWYENGRNGDEKFEKFYHDYFEYKKETYIKTLKKTGSKNKALKKSKFSYDEIKAHEQEFENQIIYESMEIVMDELEKGHTTKKACQKASVDIKEIYQWLEKGLNGDERFEEFVKVYKKEYLIPIKKVYAQALNKNVKEKDILKIMKRHDFVVNEDYKYLKKLDLYPKPEDVTLEMDDDFEINFNMKNNYKK